MSMPGRLLNIARPSASPDRSSPTNSRSNSETAVRSPSLPGMEALKRHNLAGLGAKKPTDKGKDKQSRKSEKDRGSGSQSPVDRARRKQTRIEIYVESPPVLFQGPAASSPGAIFSASLQVIVTEPEITFDSFVMDLLATVTTKKAIGHNCPSCTIQNTNLFKWDFITERKRLTTGTYSFPFSYMLPGHLPVTTSGGIGNLTYSLSARATTITGEHIDFKHTIPIARAIEPAADKNALRVFPPTHLTANVTFAPVIHPIGQFTVLMRINGITSNSDKVQHRWRLRKMNWRIEETEKMISRACDKHADKVGGPGKAMQHEETRVLGHAELKDGWKTDFAAGTIEMEFSCRPNGSPRPVCDMESPTGMSVKHALVIELVISEEWANNTKLTVGTPTGAARVLRMQFNAVMTERQGLGVSWDEEIPPKYEDVPRSPPMYSRLRGASALAEYSGADLQDPLNNEDVERWTLTEAGPAAAQNDA